MDPRHLAQLAVILEKGSITAASQALHMTQPTLTHNMKVLEQQVGGLVFTRSRMGVRSTPLGELLAREGRDILRHVQDAQSAVSRHRRGIVRQIRLGAGPLISGAFLPGLTEVIAQQQPDALLMIRTDAPDALVDQLIDGQHDLVIAPTWRDKPPPGVVRALLIHDTLGIFCGASHRLAAAGVLDPDESDDETWITHGINSPFDLDVKRMLSEAGVKAARTRFVIRGDAVALMRILMQGKHLAVLPRYPTLRLASHFPLVELTGRAAPMERPIYLWCREDLLRDEGFVRLRSLILDYAAQGPATPARTG